jgi:preprotein translocase subunit SecD
MLEYARWKYILVALVMLVALVFALPNFFGEDFALQVARKDRAAIDEPARKSVEDFLRGKNVPFKQVYIDTGRVMVRFAGGDDQLKARDAVKDGFDAQYNTALSYAPRAPSWLAAMGLKPMPLGLDLRGGLYLLYEVDTKGAIELLMQSYEQDFRRTMRENQIGITDVGTFSEDAQIENALRMTLPATADVTKAREVLEKRFADLTFRERDTAGGRAVEMVLTPAQITERESYAIQQNITTLRNRVNALGVSEPIVQRQGPNRINVQLPGVQNAAEVTSLLGKVATLEWRMEDTQNSVREAVDRGRAPLGSKLYRETNGQPVLLKRDIIVTGDQLTNAVPTVSNEGPAVSITLSSAGGDEMLRNTRKNVGRRMGVVFVEIGRETQTVNGQQVAREVKTERVISLATIRGVFSNQFQITGLTSAESRDLSLLLKAGALAAPIFLAEERAIGPTLGRENIEKGVRALLVSMAAVFAFMVIYYRRFGFVANLVLLANVVLLTALLSGLKAALSLPGIAGIILTVGMAIDANILIYERIREELRNGNSPQSSIRAGFEKAFSSIADANITTLIAGVVLWVFGTGAIRGFAVVLTLGIITSMFTALMGSRALITLMYGGKKRVAELSI